MRSLSAALAAAALALSSTPAPARAQAVPHLGVGVKNLILVELTATVNPAKGTMSQDVGIYQAGSWRWLAGQATYVVPKDQTLIVTDAQVFVQHDTGTAGGALVDLQVAGPYGYSGSMALFPFDQLAPNQRATQRQAWTSGFAIPGGWSLKAENFWPAIPSLLLQSRVLVHGYLVP